MMVPMVISPEDPSNWGPFPWALGCCPEVSNCVVPAGAWSSVEGTLCSTDQYCVTGLVDNEVPDLRVPWRGLFCHPLIHGHSFRLSLWANLSYSQQHAISRGENYSCEKKICFLKLYSTWELFENNDAGNSQFWFCIRWTWKTLAIFLRTMHLDKENFLTLL